MVIKKKKQKNRLELDLTGPEGNCYCLLGHASHLCKQLELDSKKVLAEMKEKDYEHLVKTFDKYFGEYVTLYR